MPTYKKLNGTYTIDTTEVIIKGNLTVQGIQAAIESTDTKIKDKIITLNLGETGAGVGPAGAGTAGVEVARGSLTNVSIRWNEIVDNWQITTDGVSYSNIAISGGTSGNLSLKDDPNPTLNANLITNGYYIKSNIADNVKFDGNLQINYTTVTPSLTSSAVVLYSSTPGEGTTGLYVVNQQVTNEELITKKRAFGYSLLL